VKSEKIKVKNVCTCVLAELSDENAGKQVEATRGSDQKDHRYGDRL
jgi:hypothetical protein